MRRKARTDENQQSIVKSLRQIPGVSVAVTSAMGKGFPDIIVGRKLYGGSILALVELKDGKKSASRKKLTTAEEKFKAEWKGFYHVCENIEQVLKVIGL